MSGKHQVTKPALKPMRIETIRIRNFKALRDVEIRNLPNYCVFVGANGSGKTTLFRIFGFLKNCLRNNVRSALIQEGGFNGFQEVISRNASEREIQIELQFRMPIAGIERLVTYLLCISEDADEGQPIVQREVLRYKRGRYGSPFHFLDFSCGQGYAITNEEDFDKSDEELERENQTLDSPDVLAIKGLGQFQRFKAASAFRQLIENWHVSDFHINDARGTKESAFAEHLSPSGDNLPAVARFLHDRHPQVFAEVLRKMRQRVPGVQEVESKPTEDGRLLMRYRDGAFIDPFFDKNVSDGTVKMFAYLLLLHDPHPHPVLCVEEPENQLYPHLMVQLAEEFREYAARGGQVLISTHSPDFLNGVELNEIFWLEKQNGYTAVRRAADVPNLVSLIHAGETPGSLWRKKLLHAGYLQ